MPSSKPPTPSKHTPSYSTPIASPGPDKVLAFTECLSLLSVMKNLRPDCIHAPHQRPEFQPFVAVPRHSSRSELDPYGGGPGALKVTMGGKRIASLTHEADVLKMEVLERFGGDLRGLDVYIINGQRVRELMARTGVSCVMSCSRNC
ncbi:hypothetical protein BV898_02055 [Hypsibius exemplaris]|uniref:Uncharacterized protein n=1 Tax=Hypsibius exemplaris TaxID=2072580 RepID=A0A1W0X9W4_HYPEX|nr:hypothetical protein BV898_02055 [Hypsibius exemplaris]